MMLDEASLRYQPNRMRWLYEESPYSVVAERHDNMNRQHQAAHGYGHLLGSIHFVDRDFAEDVSERFESLEFSYQCWRNSEMSRIFDLSNVVNLIPELRERDLRWRAEAEPFEDPAYIHFGRPMHGYDGFYVEFDQEDQTLRCVLVAGGSTTPLPDPAEIVATYGESATIYFEEAESAQSSIDTAIDERQPENPDELRRAFLHILATLRFIAIHYDSFEYVWPSDAPPILARKQELIGSWFGQQTAEDALWSRGWIQLQVMPLPADSKFAPHLDWNLLTDPQARNAEFLRFARHVIAQERECALTGHNEISTAFMLARHLEDAFISGANNADDFEAFANPPALDENAQQASNMLSLAAYGKSPFASDLRAHFKRAKGNRWKLCLGDDDIDLKSVTQETIDDLANAGLVNATRDEAHPTRLLKMHHLQWTPACRSRDFGLFAWGNQPTAQS